MENQSTFDIGFYFNNLMNNMREFFYEKLSQMEAYQNAQAQEIEELTNKIITMGILLVVAIVAIIILIICFKINKSQKQKRRIAEMEEMEERLIREEERLRRERMYYESRNREGRGGRYGGPGYGDPYGTPYTDPYGGNSYRDPYEVAGYGYSDPYADPGYGYKDSYAESAYAPGDTYDAGYGPYDGYDGRSSEWTPENKNDGVFPKREPKEVRRRAQRDTQYIDDGR